MRAILDFFGKSVLLTGLLIVLPAWLAVLLIVKVVAQLGGVVSPISNALPPGVNHPNVVGVAVFLLLCIIVGVLVHTTIGRIVGRTIDQAVLRRIPGYGALRNIADQLRDFEGNKGFKPALIEIEEGALCPSFLIETHDDGRSTVFIPSVPTPMAGSILIIQSERVHPLDIPVTTMMQCISKWGSGSAALLEAYQDGKSVSAPEPASQSAPSLASK